MNNGWGRVLWASAAVTCAWAAFLGTAVHAESTGTVAVLVEPGMVNYGGPPSLAPERVAPALKKAGLTAVELTAAQAGDPAVLTAQRYPVLVLPYGNAFPAPALDALVAYRKQGGCMVLTGVPFCHPIDLRDGKWVDRGGENHFQHDGKGTGTGGYAGPASGTVSAVVEGANPLRFPKGFNVPQATGPRQWLDAASLSAKDEVIPLVTLTTPEGAVQSLAAAIRHECPEYPGARDVWVGQVASDISEEHAWLAEQLIARGAAWCLREKGRTGEAGLASVMAKLDAARMPAPLPEGLAVAEMPRPWGDTFVPRSKAPGRSLFVVDPGPLSEEERTALACLQGLTSRTEPVIWIDFEWMRHGWLDWHREKGYIDGTVPVGDWTALFRRFSKAYKGAVIPDPGMYGGPLLAANVAACEDLIIASPELAQRLGLTVKVDLRGRFKTYAEGMRWVWATYKTKLNHHLCDFLHPSRLSNGAFAYDVQWRAVMFWIAGPVDANEAGTDMLAEKRVMAEIFAEMSPNSAVLGFPFNGEGVGPGEVNGVGFASRYGHPLVCTDSLANLCVLSGVDAGKLAQREKAPAPKLEKDKVYIALGMSDGDNQNTWVNGFFKSYMEHPAYGRFPLSFGMGPPIADLMPGVAQWYFEHAAPGTEFFADVSGIGYMQPQNYGLSYSDPKAVFDGFLDWTGRYLDRLDMNTLRTVEGEDELLERYAAALPKMTCLLPDMGRYSGHEGIGELTYSLSNGMPAFRSVTSWRYGKDGLLREIREQVGDVRPAFVNGFVHCWTFRMDDLAKAYDARDADMVFVTPSQLASLYREAKAKGWTK